MKYANYLGYIAGPYTAPTQKEVALNIQRATEASAALWRMQFPNICPHMNAAGFERPEWGIDPTYFYPGTMIMLDRCDFMVLVTGDMEVNKRSKGTTNEIQRCIESGKPWFRGIEEFEQYVEFAEKELGNYSYHIFGSPITSWRRHLSSK